MEYLESVVPYDPGFPSSMIVSVFVFATRRSCSDVFQGDGTSHNRMLLAVAKMAKQPKLQPILP